MPIITHRNKLTSTTKQQGLLSQMILPAKLVPSLFGSQRHLAAAVPAAFVYDLNHLYSLAVRTV